MKTEPELDKVVKTYQLQIERIKIRHASFIVLKQMSNDIADAERNKIMGN